MQDRAFSDGKISFASTARSPRSRRRTAKLSGIVVRDAPTGQTRDLDVTGLFVAIGHDLRTELFADQLDLDAEGYLKTQAPTTRTSIPGVFGAGDVVDHPYRQAITAVGSGCAAVLDAERYLAALGEPPRQLTPCSQPQAESVARPSRDRAWEANPTATGPAGSTRTP